MTSSSNPSPRLRDYYSSLESIIGYQLVLSGARHYGYYEKDTYWPFPVSASLRRMEDRLISALALPANSLVLEAGCGDGPVAIRMASKGHFRVEGIDITDRHIQNAQKNIRKQRLDGIVKVRKGSYQNLNGFKNGIFDGAYTSEALVHSTDVERALGELYRVLKPGGHIAFHEFDLGSSQSQLASPREKWYNDLINNNAAMHANETFEVGVFQRLLEIAGFEEVVVKDISEGTLPMLRLFFWLGYLPFLAVVCLGLRSHFINTVTAVKGYQHYKKGVAFRRIEVTARKPGPEMEIGLKGSHSE
jgi:sterol 24-C-methyltransferase